MKPVTLDIRGIPHAKGEPFASIMATVGALRPGEALLLIAPFKPEPLLRLLDSKGFDHQASCHDDSTWHVLFTPRSGADAATDASNPLTWPRPSLLVDLTTAPPGKATDAVLEALQSLLPQQVLFALLREEPAELPFRLLDEGHLCFGRWQEGTYRVMVLVRGAEQGEG